MFGFIQRRVLKEHMKLVAQNDLALTYLAAFMLEHIADRFTEIIADVQRTWKPATKLSDEQFTMLWHMNSALRRTYDLSSARLPGMKPFDKQFQPLLGWDNYYSQ